MGTGSVGPQQAGWQGAYFARQVSSQARPDRPGSRLKSPGAGQAEGAAGQRGGLTLHLALGVDNHAGVVLKVDVGAVLPPERLALPHHNRGHDCGVWAGTWGCRRVS